MPHFRLYTDVLNDPKVQWLSAEDFRSWINLMCVACPLDGWLPDFPQIGYYLRMSETDAMVLVKRLVELRLVDPPKGREKRYRIHNWDKWQRKSDVSTDRVKKYRTTNSFNPDSLSPEVRVFWDLIIALRWKPDAVPGNHAKDAAEIAMWLVEDREATEEMWHDWVRWWWHDPDAMGFRLKQRPWPKNIATTWDTCFSAVARPNVNNHNGRSERNVNRIAEFAADFGIGLGEGGREDRSQSLPLLGPGDADEGRREGDSRSVVRNPVRNPPV